MKLSARWISLVTLFVALAPNRVAAFQLGTTDYTKATTSTISLRGNLTLLQIHTPQDLNNILILSGPEGILMVDHPEAAAGPIVKKALDALGNKPVRFLVNSHWHYDHVGGNEIYGPDAVIVAQENVRKRLMTAQNPSWSKTPIGPYPEKAWPRITFRDQLTIHFDSEDIELDHYFPAHTDGDSVAYFAKANAVYLGDVFSGKGDIAAGVDMEGLAKSLAAVRDRINDNTIVITGHGEKVSNRRDLAEYVRLLEMTLQQVRDEVAGGKSESEIVAAGLPGWQAWFDTQKLPQAPDFLTRIYQSVTHTNSLDQ